MLLRACTLSVIAWSVFAANVSVASAWCQSCTVTRAEPTCRQECYCPSETDPDARLIAWRRPCIDYALTVAGSMDLSRAELEGVFDRAFNTWTELDCGGSPLGFQVRRRAEDSLCSVPEFVPDGGNVNSMAFVDNWSERGNAPAAYALTTTWFRRSTGEIVDADMELNQENWEFADCAASECTLEIDLENTVTHELGHFFGLAHTDVDEEATMWACADPAETFKRDLQPDDREGLCTIYAAGFEESCDFEPSGGYDPTCAMDRGDEGCGCHVGRTDVPSGGLAVLGLILGATVGRRRRRSR